MRGARWLILLVVAVIAGVGIYQTVTRPSDTSWIDEPLAFGSADATVRIERGMGGRAIGRALAEAGVLPSATRFQQLLRVTGGDNRLQPGFYRIEPSMTPRQLAALLQSGAGSVRVTIPEGWTSEQIAAALVSAELIASAASFEEAIASDPRRAEWAPARESLEGYLFPDTYQFDPEAAAAEIVAAMLKEFDRQVNRAAFSASAEAHGLEPDQAVILASIIEREARSDEERPTMAGVFLNRLERDMKLESCATVNYVLGDWSKPLSVADTRIEHPYNTYVNAGLPPGPICNPGRSSLLAAVSPEATEYLFFVYDPTLGRHRFSRTYAEHLRAVRDIRETGG